MPCWTRGNRATLPRLSLSLSLPGPMNHLPPVILLPETAVHLASLPPSTYHPGLLSFILFSGHSAVSANYCHRFFVNQLGSSRGTSLILSPVRALASSLNGICQQLDRRDRQETDPLSLFNLPRTYAKQRVITNDAPHKRKRDPPSRLVSFA